MPEHVLDEVSIWLCLMSIQFIYVKDNPCYPNLNGAQVIVFINRKKKYSFQFHIYEALEMDKNEIRMSIRFSLGG